MRKGSLRDEMVREAQRPGGDKYWSELTVEEKLERMRGVLKTLEMSQGGLRRQFDKLRLHRHGENGLLLVPIDSVYGVEEGQKRPESGKEWF